MKIATNKYYVQSTSSNTNPNAIYIANEISIELIRYGVVLTKPLFDAISSLETKDAFEFAKKLLKEHTVGKLNKPLFNNWEARTHFSIDEICVQIFGYVFQISGNDLYDPNYMDQLKSKINIKKIIYLELATVQEAYDTFISLVNSSVSLDNDTFNTIVDGTKYFPSINPIKSDESRIAVILGEYQAQNKLYDNLIAKKCKPADALRFAAALKDIKGIKLPADVKYNNLTWFERTQLLNFLNQFDYETLFENVALNREAWKRFYNHIHLFNQKDFINRFPVIGLVSRISSDTQIDLIPKQYHKICDQFLKSDFIEVVGNKYVYRPFASRIQSAIDNKNFNKIKDLLENKSSYLLRNLATVSNGVTKEHAADFVQLISNAIPKCSNGVLFSLLGINSNAKYRIIDAKGDTKVEEANYPSYFNTIQKMIENHINQKYGFPGKVIVENKIKNGVVSFTSKNTELDRGSKIDVGDYRYVYIFVKWIKSYQRTDIDLSTVSFDKNWNPEYTYWVNQVGSSIVHSGDITNAPEPHGATEYIRIDLKTVKTKYIASHIKVFCGDVFSNLKQIYAGIILSNSDKFNIEQDHIRYDLTQPAQSNVPFILNVDQKQLMLLDYNNRFFTGYTIFEDKNEMIKLISAMNDKKIITNQYLADLLSGNGDEISLKIVEKATKENEMEPSKLVTLFN